MLEICWIHSLYHLHYAISSGHFSVRATGLPSKIGVEGFIPQKIIRKSAAITQPALLLNDLIVDTKRLPNMYKYCYNGKG